MGGRDACAGHRLVAWHDRGRRGDLGLGFRERFLAFQATPPGFRLALTAVGCLLQTMDMFVTALELAGGSLPTDRTYDGRSLVPVLKSPTPEAAKTPHDFYLYYCSSRLMAVRHGNPHEHS